jgi:hypothetical protein
VDLAPEALTAPLASITLPMDYDNLDFYADPTATYQMQLECVPPSQLGCLWGRRARLGSAPAPVSGREGATAACGRAAQQPRAAARRLRRAPGALPPGN